MVIVQVEVFHDFCTFLYDLHSHKVAPTESQEPIERTLTQPVAFFFWTPAGAASLPDQEVPFGGAEKGVWPPSGRSTHWPPSENVTRSTLGGQSGQPTGTLNLLGASHLKIR